MNIKILNALLIVSSLFGYLEWGKNNQSLLVETEFTILKQLFTDPKNVVHPFILIPLIGQFLLLFTLFQRKPSYMLTYLGIACLGLLLGFMFFIGILSLNLKILLSTVPFILIATYVINYLIRTRKEIIE